ncbi:hypothetical protein GCM10027456_70700 [Kineosporia babensis]|nr:DUF305 domain-containing protein [Kineosporia babensis]
MRAVAVTGVVLAGGAVLFLAGCGALDGVTISTGGGQQATTQLATTHGSHAEPSATESAQTAEAGAGYNDADVMFLQMMVARQIETAKLTARAGDGELSKQAGALVDAIAVTEDDERAEMSGWLKAWGEDEQPADDADLHAEHGGVSTLTAADLEGLASAPETQFQTQYLNLLIAQQSNAVEIAEYVAEKGRNKGVLELAERIDTSRSAQVQQMLKLIAENPAG